MKKALFAVIFLDLLALSYGISTLSISAYEASIYFEDSTLTAFLAHLGTKILGQNDFGLRVPFVLLHFMSAILLYLYALKITKTSKDALFSLILFLLLPGTVASALCVNEASIVIFLSLLILCAYEYGFTKIFYALLIAALFVDKSFGILFLSLFFFALYRKNTPLLLITLALFAGCIGLYEFDFTGKPKGYFLDTLGVFAAAFSPLVFVYYFYLIYRLAFKPKKPMLWFIMTTSFLFCLIFSMRQRLYLEEFLPFCVISTPLLISSLMSSYRIRLPNLRLKYNIFIECAVIFLLLCYCAIIFNTFLYAFMKNPRSHFAYNYHIAKELALSLKERGINKVKTDKDMQLRLKFYGIEEGKSLFLERVQKRKWADFTISLGKNDEFYGLKRIQ